MYKKYLVVASRQDLAGTNITNQLKQFRPNPVASSMTNVPAFDFYFIEETIVKTENLDLEKINQYDFVIFASKHRSEKQEKTLSIHVPGNWLATRPELGGEAGKVCKGSALFQKQMFEILNESAKESNLEDYNITLEVTHHGPLIDKPCVFIELGSSETEWDDRKAGFVIAKTISHTIKEFQEDPYNEVAVGMGGPHYCPNFNKLQLNSNVAFSHIIPKYALPFTEEMILEAINKTEEEVDFVVLDWKGIGDEEQRHRLKRILEKNYINYKKISEISN